MGQDTRRDFFGYGNTPPQVRWPDGARVAVSVVVNFEEGAEFSIADGDTHNEAVYEVVHQILGREDPCIDSHFEYGTRAGYWRLMALLDHHGVASTLSSSGRAVEVSPWLAKDASARGHEVSAHGYRWESHAGSAMSEEIERGQYRQSRCRDRGRHRQAPGGLAHAVGQYIEHAAAVGGDGVPLRQRCL